MTDTFERNQLDGKDRGQLSEIAAALGVKAVSRMRKAELVDAIVSATSGAADAKANGSETDSGRARSAPQLRVATTSRHSPTSRTLSPTAPSPPTTWRSSAAGRVPRRATAAQPARRRPARPPSPPTRPRRPSRRHRRRLRLHSAPRRMDRPLLRRTRRRRLRTRSPEPRRTLRSNPPATTTARAIGVGVGAVVATGIVPAVRRAAGA